LVWKIDAGEGSRETRNPPRIERSGQFRQSAFDRVKVKVKSPKLRNHPLLFEGIA